MKDKKVRKIKIDTWLKKYGYTAYSLSRAFNVSEPSLGRWRKDDVNTMLDQEKPVIEVVITKTKILEAVNG